MSTADKVAELERKLKAAKKTLEKAQERRFKELTAAYLTKVEAGAPRYPIAEDPDGFCRVVLGNDRDACAHAKRILDGFHKVKVSIARSDAARKAHQPKWDDVLGLKNGFDTILAAMAEAWKGQPEYNEAINLPMTGDVVEVPAYLQKVRARVTAALIADGVPARAAQNRVAMALGGSDGTNKMRGIMNNSSMTLGDFIRRQVLKENAKSD